MGYVSLLDAPARVELLRSSLRQHRHSLSEEELANIARRTERFSSSDTKNLCREASMIAVREVPSSQVVHLRIDQLRPITVQDFLQAMQVVQPSASGAAVQELETWTQRRRK